MSEKPFRKASLERVDSPEQLNEYIRVARPGVWVMLSAIVLLLVGVIFWGAFGNIETTVDALVVLRGGEATAYIAEESAADVEAGMAVRIGESAGTVLSLSDAPARFDALVGEALAAGGYFDPGASCRTAALSIAGLPDGAYSATIVVESVNPIRFVIR